MNVNVVVEWSECQPLVDQRVCTRDRDSTGPQTPRYLFMSSPTTQRRQSTQRVVSSPLRSMTPPTSLQQRSTSGVSQSISGTLSPPASSTKTRAMDLLRKHYGLGVGPPPPVPGKSNDPMNMGMSARHPTPIGIDVAAQTRLLSMPRRTTIS